MYEDSSSSRLYMAMMECLYQNHGIRTNICGTVETISAITPELLTRCYRAFYRPDNMILTVCGRVSMEEVVAIADSVMGGLAPKPPRPCQPAAPRVRVSVSAFSPRTIQYRPVSKPLFCIGIKCPTAPAEGKALWKRDLTVSVLCETLFSHAGDFYNTLFERGTVSPGTSYGFLVGNSPRLPASLAYGYFDLSGECDDPDAVMDAFLSYVERIRREGLSREDFERAKRVIYADFVAGFDTTEDVASLLGSYTQDGLCAYDFFDALESITLLEAEALFDRVFRPEQYTLLAVYPLEAAE